MAKSRDAYNEQRIIWLIFLAGMAVATLMLFRAQVSDDGLQLLTRGWLLAVHGIVSPIGNAAAGTAGGYVPGSASAILAGLPMMLWLDHRAPAVLVLMLHVIAYVLLDRVVAQQVGGRGRILLAILFWLNPWQLYESSWVDNSNYSFFFGAVHMWACYVQRKSASFFASAILVVAIGFATQLHLNGVILAIAAALLFWRGHWRPHWGGVVAGSVLVLLSLIPWLVEAYQNPQVMPGAGGEPVATNLTKVWPVLKGLAYWFRYASLHVSREMLIFDFAPAFGGAVGPVLTVLATGFVWVAGVTTVVISLAANVWWVRYLHRPLREQSVPAPASAWLSTYAAWMLAACLVSNALSPQVTMWWHNLVGFHAATLPVILYADAWSRRAHKKKVRTSVALYGVAVLLLGLSMAFGSPHFRKGGTDPVMYPQTQPEPWADDLRLSECCTRQDVRWLPSKTYFYDKYLCPHLEQNEDDEACQPITNRPRR